MVPEREEIEQSRIRELERRAKEHNATLLPKYKGSVRMDGPRRQSRASEQDLQNDDKIFWKVYPGEDELARKISVLYGVNTDLFILKDQQFFDDKILEKELEFRDITLNLVNDEIKLYKITQNEP